MDLLIDLDEMQEGVAHRPARLYKFDQKRYEELRAKGFSFEVKEQQRIKEKKDSKRLKIAEGS
jgi:8-oxo-dGTP diphosphatase